MAKPIKETTTLNNHSLSVEVLRGRIREQVEYVENPNVLKMIFILCRSLQEENDTKDVEQCVMQLDGALAGVGMSYEELRLEAMKDKYGEYIS